MAYNGNTPGNVFGQGSKDSFNGDGSTTAFSMSKSVLLATDIDVFVGNVRQEPNVAYTVSGATLTFTGTPSSGTGNIYVVHKATSLGTLIPPTGIAGSFTTLTTSGTITSTGDITSSGTIEPAGDTSAGDNAAIGYTSTEGLILTGQGSTNDITIKNDADTSVIQIPTGTTGVTMAGTLGVSGNSTFSGEVITSTSGLANVRIGENAGDAIASGTNYNVVVGNEAGTNLNGGDSNVFVGYKAGEAATTGGSNTAVGYHARKTEDGNGTNVAVGTGALEDLNAGADAYNVSVGFSAGNSITEGIKNTIVGGSAGDALTHADFNTAVGYNALGADTLGSNSTAIGYQALLVQNFTTATDSKNTAVGHNCGVAVTTGTLNTFMGFGAGNANTTGYDNVAIGRDSGAAGTDAGGSALITGYRNILIGYGGNLSATDGSHQITLGSHIVGANSSFTFGNGGTDSRISVGATSITAPSDERYKEEITTSTAGLSFINDLRPVTFKWKKEKDIPEDHRSYVKDSDKRVMERGEKINHGFIAQEVKAVIDNHSEIKDGFDMWSADPNDGRQRLAPAELIPILVKAIQELSAKVTALENA